MTPPQRCCEGVAAVMTGCLLGPEGNHCLGAQWETAIGSSAAQSRPHCCALIPMHSEHGTTRILLTDCVASCSALTPACIGPDCAGLSRGHLSPGHRMK